MASAFASPAGRRPRRPSMARPPASLTSCVNAGSGVSFSNGTIATVLTLGSTPPAKPYRQPANHTAAALTAASPQRRRNDRRRGHSHDRELKPRRPPREIDARAHGTRPGVRPTATPVPLPTVAPPLPPH